MWTIFSILGIIIIGSAAIAGLSAAPWLPTLPSQRKHLLENLKLTDGQTVMDLGCGDGSMLFAVARQYPKVICVGYDISLLPLFVAWLRKLIFFKTYRNVHIRFGNLFKQDLSKADIVFIFLLSKSYPKLIPILGKRLNPQTKVYVEAWPFPGIEPRATLKGERLLPVYIYTGQDLHK